MIPKGLCHFKKPPRLVDGAAQDGLPARGRAAYHYRVRDPPIGRPVMPQELSVRAVRESGMCFTASTGRAHRLPRLSAGPGSHRRPYSAPDAPHQPGRLRRQHPGRCVLERMKQPFTGLDGRSPRQAARRASHRADRDRPRVRRSPAPAPTPTGWLRPSRSPRSSSARCGPCSRAGRRSPRASGSSRADEAPRGRAAPALDGARRAARPGHGDARLGQEQHLRVRSLAGQSGVDRLLHAAERPHEHRPDLLLGQRGHRPDVGPLQDRRRSRVACCTPRRYSSWSARSSASAGDSAAASMS